MTDIALNDVERKKVDMAEAYLNGAKNFVIDNNESFESANSMLKEIKVKKKEYDDMRKRLKKPIIEAGKNIEDFFRSPINYLTQAEQAYKKSILEYQQAIQKLVTETETKKTEDTADLQQKALDALKENDYKAYAKNMLEITQLEQTEVAVPKSDGVSFRDNWKGEVTDMAALIDAVANDKAPISLLKVDESALNSLAKSTKGTVSYPGIKFVNDKIVAVKTG